VALIGLGAALALVLSSAVARSEPTLNFSGYRWTIRAEDGLSGPGPNLWDPKNAWLDEHGWLHLKITKRGDRWYCAEVYLSQNLGFGRYEWEVAGPVDHFDPQVVLGLFNYTRPEIGPDGTNEIDIEFARWGRAANPAGNFTVFPATNAVKEQTQAFPFKLDGPGTTSRFDWSSKSVKFETLAGYPDTGATLLGHWDYAPSASEKYIPQNPLPVHLNFWLFEGKPPLNNQVAEVVIRKFTFTARE
jgi:hypothetical protein